jgi:hypothetical protein
MVELMIALILGLVVVLAIGSLVLQNQRSWRWNKDKTVLQQNVTESLEWMARQVRAARSVQVVSSEEFRTYDENDALVHRYEWTGDRLQQDGSDLVDRKCTDFQVFPDEDTTSVTIVLELEDDAFNLVGGSTRAAIRNQTYEF